MAGMLSRGSVALRGSVADPDVLPSTAPPATEGGEATHFLLYLNKSTYVGTPGERLASQLRAVRATSLPIVMVHECDPARGACDFSRFFETVRTSATRATRAARGADC